LPRPSLVPWVLAGAFGHAPSNLRESASDLAAHHRWLFAALTAFAVNARLESREDKLPKRCTP